MRDVVGIHPRNERGRRFGRDAVAADRQTQRSRALEDADAPVPPRPVPQHRARSIGRPVVEDEELEVLEGLVQDALDALVEIGEPVEHGHDDTDRGCVH